MLFQFDPYRYNSILLKNKKDPCMRKAKLLKIKYIDNNNKEKNVNFKENTPIFLYDIEKLLSAEYGLDKTYICVLDELIPFLKNTESGFSNSNLPVCSPRSGGGFFSCCSMILSTIVGYYNKLKVTPFELNTNIHYKNYYTKELYNGNLIRNNLFKNHNEFKPILFDTLVDYKHNYQYSNYKEINIKKIIPFVEKFFSPSHEIKELFNELSKKYNIDYKKNNYCGVYYRGTDKWKETKISSVDSYINKMLEIQDKDKNVIFIIQTDTTKFIETIKSSNKIKNYIIFEENKTSNTNKGTHWTFSKEENYNQIKYCMTIFHIIANCNSIIFGTGNCSIWITFFRGNTNNIYQSLNNVWV